MEGIRDQMMKLGSMAWILLVIAGVLEVAWAVGMKYSQGFTRPVASGVTILLMVLSFVFLSQAVRMIPLGTAYAVWTGIGALGTAAAGIFLFQEPAGAARLFFMFLVLAGITGLKLFSQG